MALLATPGCYLGHVAQGQARLLWNRRSVASVLEDPATPEPLRERLRLVERVRAFGSELGLAVEGQYTSFAEVPGDAVVTTVVAARPGELEPAGFWYPLVGRLPYKGFFDPARAEAEAERLRERGLDTCVSPVVAYSTLGWFDDPLTGPLLRLEDGPLVEVLLHELTHASVFVAGDADFNEGLATFVGQEAAVRFWEQLELWEHQESGEPQQSPAQAETERARVADDRAVAEQLARFRAAVEALYASEPTDAAQRRELEEQARRAIAALPLRTLDAPALAARVRLNDACQALAGAYDADLPAYATQLDVLGGDLPAFLAAAREAADTPEPRCTLIGVCEVEPDSPAVSALSKDDFE